MTDSAESKWRDFDEFWKSKPGFYRMAKLEARAAWNARDPEITALKDRLAELEGDRILLYQYAKYVPDYITAIDLNDERYGLTEFGKGMLSLALVSLSSRGHEASSHVECFERLDGLNRQVKIDWYSKVDLESMALLEDIDKARKALGGK